MTMINDSTPLVNAEIIREETVDIRWNKIYRIINKAKKKGCFQCKERMFLMLYEKIGKLTNEEFSKLVSLSYRVYLNKFNFNSDHIIDWRENKNEES